ncbi:MAG: hypothetical protein KCHDKBKB_02969 [Elusimicrobia bacterium]|nr:hypothetical protein [Elusimicrobiota bacterium]
MQAYYDCRKNKRRTINALKFELDLELHLRTILTKLKNRRYKPGRSICFVVTVPKPREIFAAEFQDRVIHHVLINQVQKIWETKIFIEDSYACRPEKGNHYGVKRLEKYAKEYTYYGTFDIANFFGSMDKNIMYQCFSKVILQANRPAWWKEEVLWLAKTILFHNPATNYVYRGYEGLKKLVPSYKSLIHKDGLTGLPIGNLTSQFLANVYLNELDQFVTKTLGLNGYGRYVDDFVIFANSKEELRLCRDKIKNFLKEELSLTLHPKKTQIQKTAHGIPFVGYYIKPWVVTVRRNVVKTLKNKIYYWNKHRNIEEMLPSINSYFGHLGKAKSGRLRHHLISKHLSPEMKTKIVVIGNWRYLKARKGIAISPPPQPPRQISLLDILDL